MWGAPIVGYSDRLGYLRCSDCAGEDQRDTAYSGDGYFCEDDICERCGWRFQHIPTAQYVQISDWRRVPDLRRPEMAKQDDAE